MKPAGILLLAVAAIGVVIALYGYNFVGDNSDNRALAQAASVVVGGVSVFIGAVGGVLYWFG